MKLTGFREKSALGTSNRHTLIIAELSANHGGRFDRAVELVKAAYWAGADALKIQLYTPEQMAPQSEAPEFQIEEGPWAGSLYDLYVKARTPLIWVPRLRELARSLRLAFIISVYHPDMVPTALEFQPDVLKVASQEIAYLDLLDALVKVDKPVIFSTGTAVRDEIEDVVEKFKGREIALLKCVSQYPAPLEAMNLATIPDMVQRFKVPIGLSDHSKGCVCAVVATALGSQILEKHIRLPADDTCLDAAFSATPQEFKSMVVLVRAAEEAMGKVDYTPSSLRFKRKLLSDGTWMRTTQ